MAQVNVNPAPTTMVRERSGAGMMVGLLVGLLLLLVLGWYLFTQSGLFGAAPARPASGGSTSVNITTNAPATGGQTGGQPGAQPGAQP
ncbi:MAG TPA: hypothetical protein VFN74_07530, partial [Chloroflexota bacterium]|nr:hypothetical protein [Chloroflexota bacterium]